MSQIKIYLKINEYKGIEKVGREMKAELGKEPEGRISERREQRAPKEINEKMNSQPLCGNRRALGK
jgi:hypothetical protein